MADRSHHSLPIIPAAMFGVVLGLAGLAGNWRLAAAQWGLPSIVGAVLDAVAVLVWATLVVLFAAKWVFARTAALEEAAHPVNCCFIGLIGVATMLIASSIEPYSRGLGVALLLLGLVFTIAFAIWRTGTMWRGGRDPATTTPVLYLPTVAGCLVSALVLGEFEFDGAAQLLAGAGFFTWLALESVVLQRLLTAPEMLVPIRPTLGLVIAPPAVGCAAYLHFSPGPPDVFANALLGYGLLQVVLVARAWAWIARQPFGTSFWTVTLGTTALATAALRMAERGAGNIGGELAPYLFVFANFVVGSIVVGTISLLAKGHLLSGAAVPVSSEE